MLQMVLCYIDQHIKGLIKLFINVNVNTIINGTADPSHKWGKMIKTKNKKNQFYFLFLKKLEGKVKWSWLIEIRMLEN